MRARDIPGFDNLSIPEKILLVEDLWNSIAAQETNVPVPQSHVDELDRRLKRYKSDPGSLLSFEELREGISRKR